MKEAWSADQRAAALGDSSAELAVGKTIYLGCVDIGQAADPQAALHWLRRAAEHGQPQARIFLRFESWGHAAGWLYLKYLS